MKMDINEIATLANKQKVSKADAFNTVRLMIESGISSKLDFAKLYSYFLPPIPTKPKTTGQWIAKAMAKNDRRKYLNYIYVTNNRIVAMDGHRLHIATTDLADGYYDTQLNNVYEDAKYPDFDRIMPDKKGATIIDMPDDGFPLVVAGRATTYKINDCHVMKPYLDQALSGIKDPVIYYTGARSAILIKDNLSDRKAVIMPMRV